MTIERVFVRDVTIIHPLMAASYGNSTEPDYDNGTDVATKGWLHQLAESEQQSATRDAEVSTHVLRIPTGTVIGSFDRVVVDDQTFEVTGPPSRNWSLHGEHHVRVALRYIDG